MVKTNGNLYGPESDIRLLQFLQSNNSDRFTKLDAFCDLIGRMYNEKQTNHRDKQVYSPLCYGCFTGSISDLAQSWNWHRATVRTFLDGLENLGLLTRQLHGRDYTFFMRRKVSLVLPVFSYETILHVAYYFLGHWDEYSISAEFIASYFEEYEQILLDTHQFESGSVELANKKAEIILNAFRLQEFSDTQKLNNWDSALSLLSSTFYTNKTWSWKKWIKALMFLDIIMMGSEFPDTHCLNISDDNPPVSADFTDSDLSLLRNLFYLVKPLYETAALPEEEKEKHSSLSSNDA